MSNWILKENSNQFKEVDFDIYQKLIELSIPVIELETFVDWNNISSKYNFFYDYVGNEIDIKKKLIESPLNNYSTVIIHFDCGIPTIEINTLVFIDKWEDFVSSNGYSGIFIFTNDGKYFIEFTDDSSYELYSNFLL